MDIVDKKYVDNHDILGFNTVRGGVNNNHIAITTKSGDDLPSACLTHESRFGERLITKLDFSGNTSLILISDMTELHNLIESNTNKQIEFGFVGQVFDYRSAQDLNSRYDVTIYASYNRNGIFLRTSNPKIIIPCIVKYDSKVYLACFINASQRNLLFKGYFINMLSEFIQINCNTRIGELTNVNNLPEISGVEYLYTDKIQLYYNYYSEFSEVNREGRIYKYHTDLDSLKNTGIYPCYGVTDNNTDSASVMVVLNMNTKIIQKRIALSDGSCKIRTFQNNKWGNWSVVALEGNYIKEGSINWKKFELNTQFPYKQYSYTELDNLQINGNYVVYKQIDGMSIPFVVSVIKFSNEQFRQTMFDYELGCFKSRGYDDGKWSNWIKHKFDGTCFNNYTIPQDRINFIRSFQNLDEATSAGVYMVGNNAPINQQQNTPSLLLVQTYTNPSDGRIFYMQTHYNNQGGIKYRVGIDSGSGIVWNNFNYWNYHYSLMINQSENTVIDYDGGNEVTVENFLKYCQNCYNYPRQFRMEIRLQKYSRVLNTNIQGNGLIVAELIDFSAETRVLYQLGVSNNKVIISKKEFAM